MTGGGGSARSVRVATVGAGFFAQFHLEGWARNPRAVLAAICDRDAERCKEAIAAHGGEAFSDAALMLDTVRPDILDIATPPETHAALVALAAERGIDCICQKPLAPTLAEAEAIVRQAEAAGIKLIVHENFRFQPWYRKIAQMLAAGQIGTPYQATFRLRPGDGQGPDAYLGRQPYFQAMPRFLMHETGVHLIDVFRFLLGEPVSVMADLRRLNPAIAGEDAGLVLLEMAGGVRAVFDGNRLASHAARNPRLTMGEFWLEGSAGTIMLDGDGGLSWLPHGAARAEPVAYDWQDRQFGGDCVYALQDHVVDHMLDGTPLENTGREYLAVIRTVDAAYRAAEAGQRLTL